MAGLSHSFPVWRVSEVLKWVESGEHKALMSAPESAAASRTSSLRLGVSKSRIPTLLAAFYALSFAVALYLDSITQGMGPWGFFVIPVNVPMVSAAYVL